MRGHNGTMRTSYNSSCEVIVLENSFEMIIKFIVGLNAPSVENVNSLKDGRLAKGETSFISQSNASKFRTMSSCFYESVVSSKMFSKT